MSDPMNPETLDDTVLMDGIVDSVAVESIGLPTVIFWITEAATGDQHQMNGSLLTDVVSRLAMLQLLQHAVVDKRDVKILRDTVYDTGDKWFHLVRMLHMGDDLTPGPVQVPVTVALRIFIITDEAGNSPFADDSIVASDVAITSSIWQQAASPWSPSPCGRGSPPTCSTSPARRRRWSAATTRYPGQTHVDVYYIETTDKGAGVEPAPTAMPVRTDLTDQEKNTPENAANWRGIASAHEFGHNLGLLHARRRPCRRTRATPTTVTTPSSPTRSTS